MSKYFIVNTDLISFGFFSSVTAEAGRFGRVK
jgi:hypothetical protein